MNYKEYFKKRTLLTKGGNTKINKNTIVTYNLSLRPHSLNSKKENLCTFSTKECRDLCLNGTGRGNFKSVQEGRSRKTEFYVQHKTDFLTYLASELSRINARFDKVLVRLNTFSDIDWKEDFKLIGIKIEDFINIIFYDYSKNPQYIFNKSKNQEFTFSYSGYNWKKCEDFLKDKQCNVAVVFEKFMPTTYKGYAVLNGIKSDMRLKEFDGTGNIIGLIYKKSGKDKTFKNFIVKQ